MNRMEKLGVTLKIFGIVLAIFGFMYILGVAGASDSEYYTHIYHSNAWIIRHGLIGLCCFAFGPCLVKISEYVMTISHKKFRKVWIKNLVSNEIKYRIIEDGSTIILSPDEVIYKMDRKVYCFR